MTWMTGHGLRTTYPPDLSYVCEQDEALEIQAAIAFLDEELRRAVFAVLAGPPIPYQGDNTPVSVAQHLEQSS